MPRELLDATSASTRDEVSAMLAFIDSQCKPVLSAITPSSGVTYGPLATWEEQFGKFEAMQRERGHWPCETAEAQELFSILSGDGVLSNCELTWAGYCININF